MYLYFVSWSIHRDTGHPGGFGNCFEGFGNGSMKMDRPLRSFADVKEAESHLKGELPPGHRVCVLNFQLLDGPDEAAR